MFTFIVFVSFHVTRISFLQDSKKCLASGSSDLSRSQLRYLRSNGLYLLSVLLLDDQKKNFMKIDPLNAFILLVVSMPTLTYPEEDRIFPLGKDVSGKMTQSFPSTNYVRYFSDHCRIVICCTCAWPSTWSSFSSVSSNCPRNSRPLFRLVPSVTAKLWNGCGNRFV